MSFPWHHQPWREVAEFVGPRVSASDRVLAPDELWTVVTRVERYVPVNLGPDASYDWVVLDIDVMPQVPKTFLEGVAARMFPVFVNRQFVVWAAVPCDADQGARSDLAEFWRRLAKLGAVPSEPNRCLEDRALVDSPRITRLSHVNDDELRAEMNEFHRRIGYLYPTARDKAYRAEMTNHIAAFLESSGPARVLDVATGGERFVEVPPDVTVVRSDLAEVGVASGRDRDEACQNLSYVAMDARRLAFADATFDAVVFTDAIEHVRHAGRVLQEARRVLRPRGELLLTFANLNSVNQILAEKLGYPRFPTNHQHFREFTLAEVRGLLDDAGLQIVETAGVMLYPYWGVPGVDDIVRTIIDDDPEFVAMMAELGRRVGAEYAYTGVVVARRPPG